MRRVDTTMRVTPRSPWLSSRRPAGYRCSARPSLMAVAVACLAAGPAGSCSRCPCPASDAAELIVATRPWPSSPLPRRPWPCSSPPAPVPPSTSPPSPLAGTSVVVALRASPTAACTPSAAWPRWPVRERLCMAPLVAGTAAVASPTRPRWPPAPPPMCAAGTADCRRRRLPALGKPSATPIQQRRRDGPAQVALRLLGYNRPVSTYL